MLLYKYTSARSALKTVCTGMLRFTQPAILNDTHDCAPEITGLLPRERFFASGALEAVHYLVWQKARAAGNPLALVPFPQFLAENRHLANAVLEEVYDQKTRELPDFLEKFLGKMIGVLSLSECEAHEMMWSHYADEHRGCVLAFDGTHPSFDTRVSPDDPYRSLVQMEYVATVPRLTYEEITSSPRFMYMKTSDWATEREWRLIRPLSAANHVEADPKRPDCPVCLFAFPADCLRRVILGTRISVDDEELVVKALAAQKYAHVQMERRGRSR